MFVQDFLTHRQSQSGAATSLSRLEHREDLIQIVRFDAFAIVLDIHVHALFVGRVAGANRHAPLLHVFAGVNGVGDDVQNGAMHGIGVEGEEGQGGGRLIRQLDVRVGGT